MTHPPHSVDQLVEAYFENRGLHWPDIWQALGWLQTELAEVYEILLRRDGDPWVRNNPDDHKVDIAVDHLEEELGDVVFMAIVAGLCEGLNPVAAMLAKMKEKLDASNKHQR